MLFVESNQPDSKIDLIKSIASAAGVASTSSSAATASSSSSSSSSTTNHHHHQQQHHYHSNNNNNTSSSSSSSKSSTPKNSNMNSFSKLSSNNDLNGANQSQQIYSMNHHQQQQQHMYQPHHNHLNGTTSSGGSSSGYDTLSMSQPQPFNYGTDIYATTNSSNFKMMSMLNNGHHHGHNGSMSSGNDENMFSQMGGDQLNSLMNDAVIAMDLPPDKLKIVKMLPDDKKIQFLISLRYVSEKQPPEYYTNALKTYIGMYTQNFTLRIFALLKDPFSFKFITCHQLIRLIPRPISFSRYGSWN